MSDLKLPPPAHRGPDGTGGYFDAYTEQQVREIVAADRAARRAVPARDKEAILQELTDQAQELNLGYGPPAVPASAADDDAGPLAIACIINKKLGDYIAGRTYLLPDDLAALRRFYECATDFDSGGHDVRKEMMARLREIGVVQSLGFGRHQTTSFGDYVLERNAGEPLKLPLKTLAERNADAASGPQVLATQVPAQGEVDAKDAGNMLRSIAPRRPNGLLTPEADEFMRLMTTWRFAMVGDQAWHAFNAVVAYIDAAMQQPAEGGHG